MPLAHAAAIFHVPRLRPHLAALSLPGHHRVVEPVVREALVALDARIA
jgi:hypothetical protein